MLPRVTSRSFLTFCMQLRRRSLTVLAMHNASTYIVQHTHVTVRCGSGSAYGASMINQPVAEVIALLGWDDFPKLHLHFFRVLYSIYKSYTVAKAYAVCVGDDGRLAVHITHNQVALFLPTPGNFSRSVILSGTRLPKSSRSILMQALISRALSFPGRMDVQFLLCRKHQHRREPRWKDIF